MLQLVVCRSLAWQDWAQEPHLGLPNTPGGEAPSLEPMPGRYHPAPTMEVRQSVQVLSQAGSRSLPSLLCLRYERSSPGAKRAVQNGAAHKRRGSGGDQRGHDIWTWSEPCSSIGRALNPGGW